MGIGSAKVYFNARFDDVMLIVKREMASALGGPSQVTHHFTMCSVSTLSGKRISAKTFHRGEFANCLDSIHVTLKHC